MLISASLACGAMRVREFARLDAAGLAYLDYTGAALYPASLVRRDARRLATRVLGNPHSESAPSIASTDALEEARRLTLRLLDADPNEYDVVFTANATAAIRILAEAFPFTSGSRLVLSPDNHNSVNGLRVAASPVLGYRGPFILAGKMPAVPLADVTLQQKDMLLALEQGRKLGSPVPLAAAANEMMNACRGLGIDHRDFVTAHEVYRRLGGQS